MTNPLPNRTACRTDPPIQAQPRRSRPASAKLTTASAATTSVPPGAGGPEHAQRHDREQQHQPLGRERPGAHTANRGARVTQP